MTTKPLIFPPLDLSRDAVAARIWRGLYVLRLHADHAPRDQLRQAVVELEHLAQRLLAAELKDAA